MNIDSFKSPYFRSKDTWSPVLAGAVGADGLADQTVRQVQAGGDGGGQRKTVCSKLRRISRTQL